MLFCNSLLRQDSAGCRLGACKSLRSPQETPPVNKRKADAYALTQTAKGGPAS